MILAGVPLEVEIGTWFLSQSLAVGCWNHHSCPLSPVTLLETPEPNRDPESLESSALVSNLERYESMSQVSLVSKEHLQEPP